MLYCRQGVAPTVLSIVQPGRALGGGNWTHFENNEGFFKRLALRNAAGLPRYLLYGGDGPPSWYRTACWKEYRQLTAWIVRSRRRTLGLWKLGTAESCNL